MFRIDSIDLREGNSKPKSEKCESINLITGGNNAGKTTLLAEIYNEVVMLFGDWPGHKWTAGMKLKIENAKSDVSRIFPKIYSQEKFCNYENICENIFIPQQDKDKQRFLNWNERTFELLKRTEKENFDYEFNFMGGKEKTEGYDLFRFLTEFMVKYESCTERLNIAFNTNIPYIGNPPKDFIFHLYKNRKLFAQIQNNIKEVYGLQIDFDNITQGVKAIRILRDKVNKKITDPFKLNKEWDSKAAYLDFVGHGIRSYLKLMLTLLDPTNQIIIIDEPETFIHPPQRRALGKLISDLAIEQNKQLFIATHDSEFLRGVLSSSLKKIKVFRLFNDSGKHRYTTVSANDIDSLLKKRTSDILNERILNSLFYGKTILCENENDRVIYEEATALYHRKKFHNVNFIGLFGHAEAIAVYNKLKEFKIAIAVVVDIDYLLGGNFPSSIDDSSLKNHFNSLQTDLKVLFPKTNPNKKLFKSNGVKYFRKRTDAGTRSKLQQVINEFKKHEVFIVSSGELESWTGTDKYKLNDSLSKIRSKTIPGLKNFLTHVIS